MKELKRLIAIGNPVEIKKYMDENDFELRNNKIFRTGKKHAEAIVLKGFWDQRSHAKKIILNSCYGAILNLSFRFYDERLGQSTTLTGRTIVKHMNAKVNEVITGRYDYLGDSLIASDTDSVMFSAYMYLKDDPEYADFDWSRENIIALYDEIANLTNETFPEFMRDKFNTTLERGKIIKAGREYVASTGLFIKKKKYAVLIYDLEGKRMDMDMDKEGKPVPGKLKAMGLDLKRADTPKFMQTFLQSLLMDVLQRADQKKMYTDIKDFRELFVDRPGWEKGSPKRVSNITKYVKLIEQAEAVNIHKKGNKYRIKMPGHARASLNWNKLCEMNNDKYSMKITDGTRIIVCKLKSNAMKMDSVAYPIDEPHIPKWFKEMPFDHESMEEAIIDAKLKNLVGVLDWDMTETKNIPGGDFFSFGDDKVKEKDERFGHNGGPEWDEDDEDDD